MQCRSPLHFENPGFWRFMSSWGVLDLCLLRVIHLVASSPTAQTCVVHSWPRIFHLLSFQMHLWSWMWRLLTVTPQHRSPSAGRPAYERCHHNMPYAACPTPCTACHSLGRKTKQCTGLTQGIVKDMGVHARAVASYSQTMVRLRCGPSVCTVPQEAQAHKAIWHQPPAGQAGGSKVRLLSWEQEGELGLEQQQGQVAFPCPPAIMGHRCVMGLVSSKT